MHERNRGNSVTAALRETCRACGGSADDVIDGRCETDPDYCAPCGDLFPAVCTQRGRGEEWFKLPFTMADGEEWGGPQCDGCGGCEYRVTARPDGTPRSVVCIDAACGAEWGVEERPGRTIVW